MIQITLPLPPKELHAHAKGHWRAKAVATKACRTLAHVETLAIGATPMGRATLSLDIYYPDLRQRDVYNTAQGCKPYIDGLVDAGVIAGDHWQVLSGGHIRPHLDRANPRVVITLEPDSEDQSDIAAIKAAKDEPSKPLSQAIEDMGL